MKVVAAMIIWKMLALVGFLMLTKWASEHITVTITVSR